MKIFIELEGKIYETKNQEGKTAAAASEKFFDGLDKLEKMRFELKDNSILVLGATALQKAAVRFAD